ncbi:E3 ubiquitin-protein ligase MARCHF11-like [Paramacrobiotus metropolitanus]|uniref:E3 ubiquitin-protein ligase MARCHF11-like n=1 Tax=Paramacrobiotus metropolitanus TaxID=2943436 RepID=UPI0024462E55|nr:E3 ubiquitin-protein ligase MARCHF11-like [Paramacrobiotus metropolitanus]
MSKGSAVNVPGNVYPDLQYLTSSYDITALAHQPLIPVPVAPLAPALPPSAASQHSLHGPAAPKTRESVVFSGTKIPEKVTPSGNPSLLIALQGGKHKDVLDDDPLLDLPEAAAGDCHSTRNRLTSNTSRMSAAQCRICFSASGDNLATGNTPILVHPCACDGSIRFCHPECLLQWVRQSGSFVCELCKTRYRIKRSGLKRCTQWRMPATDSIDWIHMVIFFFSVAFIVGSIVWMTWLGLGQRLVHPAAEAVMVNYRAHEAAAPPDAGVASPTVSALGDFMVPAFILYSIIDVLFLFIAGMELVFTITPLLRKWYRMNQKLIIENHDVHVTHSLPRYVNANMIAASANGDGNHVLGVQASIPCVNEERERMVQEHNNML